MREATNGIPPPTGPSANPPTSELTTARGFHPLASRLPRVHLGAQRPLCQGGGRPRVSPLPHASSRIASQAVQVDPQTGSDTKFRALCWQHPFASRNPISRGGRDPPRSQRSMQLPARGDWDTEGGDGCQPAKGDAETLGTPCAKGRTVPRARGKGHHAGAGWDPGPGHHGNPATVSRREQQGIKPPILPINGGQTGREPHLHLPHY